MSTLRKDSGEAQGWSPALDRGVEKAKGSPKREMVEKSPPWRASNEPAHIVVDFNHLCGNDDPKRNAAMTYSRCTLLQYQSASHTPSTSFCSSQQSPRSSNDFGGLFTASIEQLAKIRTGSDMTVGMKPSEEPALAPVAAARHRLGSAPAETCSPVAAEETTVQLVNVPPGYTRTMLCERLTAHGFGHCIDFLYLPKGEGDAKNAGYAVLNLLEVSVAMDPTDLREPTRAYERFREIFDNKAVGICLPDCGWSPKLCAVNLLPIQGMANHMRKLNTAANRARWTQEGEPWEPLFLDKHNKLIRMSLTFDEPEYIRIATPAGRVYPGSPSFVPTKARTTLKAGSPSFVPSRAPGLPLPNHDDFTLDVEELRPSSPGA